MTETRWKSGQHGNCGGSCFSDDGGLWTFLESLSVYTNNRYGASGTIDDIARHAEPSTTILSPSLNRPPAAGRKCDKLGHWSKQQPGKLSTRRLQRPRLLFISERWRLCFRRRHGPQGPRPSPVEIHFGPPSTTLRCRKDHSTSSPGYTTRRRIHLEAKNFCPFRCRPVPSERR